MCLFSVDPFATALDDDGGSASGNFIHIRIQQRNGRKTLTTVQGISSDYDLKKIVKACKKVGENLLWGAGVGTTVQGISSDYDLKKIVKACKKVGENNYLFYVGVGGS